MNIISGTRATYLVQGCGVSLICAPGETMLGWLKEIIERGGVPTVTKLEERHED